MKKISEKKLEAFTVGTMGKRQLSKKELEDQKKREDEEAAAHVFKEFVETFQETPQPYTKVWVKAGTYDAGSRREDSRDKGKLYKPSSSKVGPEKAVAAEYASKLAADLKSEASSSKKKQQEKKKSNLELFKEELRQIQEEREERHKYKHMAGQMVVQHTTSSSSSAATESNNQQQAKQEQQQQLSQAQSAEGREGGSFDSGDPSTTNLYLGNLSPKISEQQLMEIFGRYGPLASIKIMWPRSEEEKLRGRNCGFVAYMSRKDAERALRTLNGRYIMGCEMRLGWAKSVPVLNQPIFIPPPLLEMTLPPPPSGLPFNAQPPPSDADKIPKKNYKEYTTDEEREAMKKVLPKAIVKVLIPTEKAVLNVIHRMIEFVIREGPLFEALIMTREMENPLFSFLFDNESPAHIYYRWKLYSLLQGDTPGEWNEKEFRMFKDGPIWRPPIANFYTQGMPDELVVDPEATENQKGALSSAQRDRLEEIIRNLTPERSRIGDAMIFCIEHADAADEICECLSESLAISTTKPSRKIARLYLISDILHNCTVKVSNASFYRKSIEKYLLEIFGNLHTFYTAIESRIKAEGFKTRVCTVLKTWDEWAVYPKEFLTKLRYIFLGKQYNDPLPAQAEEQNANIEEDEDIDGAPLAGDQDDDEDLDGVPLDGAALLKGVLMRGLPETKLQQRETPTRRQNDSPVDNDYNDDIDGVPLEEDIDGIPLAKSSGVDYSEQKSKSGAFIPSKWETIDPEQVEAQAVTTSKWETLDPPQPPKISESSSDSESDSHDGNDDDDDDDGDDDMSVHKKNYKHEVSKRHRLREIELKTMQYQDELESGKRALKPGYTLSEQVEQHRRKLLHKDSHSQYVDSPLSLMNSRRSESPEHSSRRRRKRSPSEEQYSGSSRSSPPRNSSRRRSRSPYVSRSRGDISPANSSRSSKSTKRHRSRSASDSPKRYSEQSSKHGSSKSSRYAKSPSPSSNSRSAKRDDYYGSSTTGSSTNSSSAHRSHKYKHSH